MSEATLLDEAGLATLARSLCERAATSAAAQRRLIVGIAGVPGSGKSTLAERLTAAANEAAGGQRLAVALPMDGFHLPNAELDRLGLRNRKGAPETFAATDYVALLRRCRDRTHAEPFPIYDRALHEPRFSDAPAHRVTPASSLIVTEGNYLLLDRPPWSQLAEVLDETWWLQIEQGVARRWIIARHRSVGRSPAEAERRYRVDAANAELVRHTRRRPDRLVTWPPA